MLTSRARPRPRHVTALVLWTAGALGLTGCHALVTPNAAERVEQVLRPAQPSRESVAIEIVLVRVPDARLPHLDDVWNQADEMILGASVRRELARNGLRAGVIGPAPPDGLTELLQIPTVAKEDDSLWQEITLDQRPTVTGRLTQMRPNTRTEINAPTTYDALSLFIGTDEGLVGRNYNQAQGVYALEWSPLPQGRIQVELTPELHHGSPRRQYAAGEGNDLKFQVAQTREIFDRLRIRAPLSAGQMLLISGDPKNRGSLGHFFHTMPTTEGGQQRIVLIRLAQVPDQGS